MLVLAAQCDEVMARFLAWQVRQVEAAGVDVALGQTATADAIVHAGADDVVIATGAHWTPRAGVRGIADLRAWFLGEDDSVGPRVAVLGADLPGLGVAELAARRGCDVTVHDPGTVAGVGLGLPGRFRRVHDLRELGVRFELGTGAPVDADTVIDAAPAVRRPALADELGEVAVHVVGDAAAVAHLEGALAAAAGLVDDLAP